MESEHDHVIVNGVKYSNESMKRFHKIFGHISEFPDIDPNKNDPEFKYCTKDEYIQQYKKELIDETV